MVREVVGGFVDEEERLRLQYRDDEGTYVTMNKESDVTDAVRSSYAIPQNDEMVRVCIRIDNDFTPTSKATNQQEREAPDKRPCNLISDSKRKLTYPLRIPEPSTDLMELLESEPKKEKKRSSSEACKNEFQSPLERYIEKMESDLENKRTKLQELEAKNKATQEKLNRVRSYSNDGKNMCRNCHLRLGHTARNCDYGKCESVFSCGEGKVHPGELNTKQERSNIQKIKSEIMGLERNIAQQQEASNQIKESLVNKIEESLLEEDEATYTRNGHRNWPLIRKHVYLIENYCKKNLGGKIPPKHKLTEILNCALNNNETQTNTTNYTSIRQTKSTKSKGNPTKETLESCGIKFPVDCNTETKPSSIYRSAPDNVAEEQEQLNMVIKQSILDTPKAPPAPQTQPLLQHQQAVMYQPYFPPNYLPPFANYPAPPNVCYSFSPNNSEQALSNNNILFGAGMAFNRNAYAQMPPVAVPTMTDSEPTSQHHVEPVPVAEDDTETAQLLLSFKNSLNQ